MMEMKEKFIMEVLVTGSSGLIGFENVIYYDRNCHQDTGIDNMPAEFFSLPGIWIGLKT